MHKEANEIRAAYHGSTWFKDWVNLTQWWEDYLDRRQPGKSVEDAKAGRMIAAPDTSSPLSLQIVGAVGANGKNPALMRV